MYNKYFFNAVLIKYIYYFVVVASYFYLFTITTRENIQEV